LGLRRLLHITATVPRGGAAGAPPNRPSVSDFGRKQPYAYRFSLDFLAKLQNQALVLHQLSEQTYNTSVIDCGLRAQDVHVVVVM